MRSGSPAENSGLGIKEIPYDYVATFKLTGKLGNRLQDIITISTEGTFVAVSVASSFVPAPNAIAVPATAPPPFDVIFTALFPTAGNSAFKAAAEGMLLRAAAAHFLYTIVDSGSGRELQNKAVHSVAGLGAADGHRPFRPFARPVPFVPRATIRIEIEELSVGPLFENGTLFLVLHGYKRLGEA
jgi:hypothetical protein